MKHILFVILFFSAALSLHAQDYLTRNGNITFFSHTPLEDIKASNNEVVSLLSSSGNIDFKIAVKSFHFSKQAMEDHFNGADYMNSEKFPKASFSGKIVNFSDVNFSKDGTYNITVQGNITIKDITKPVTAKGTVTVAGGKVTATSSFSIKRKDFNVIGESFVQKKIAEDIQVTVNCVYEKR